MKKPFAILLALMLCAALAVTGYFAFFNKGNTAPKKKEKTNSKTNLADIISSANESNTAEENEKADGEEKTTQKTSQESKTEPTTPARTIVGLWAGATDNEFYYLFNDDKTGSFALGGEIKDFTYTDNGDSVTIVFNNNTKEHIFKYSIDGDVLSIENDFGAIEKYNLQ
ncbi:MAG: hypothetical protein E7515_04275 [Ruminococcaceae bacterium]|nr:hypothetical protein [Oscillospiraceae bacterium]